MESLVQAAAGAQFVVALSKSHLNPGSGERTTDLDRL